MNQKQFIDWLAQEDVHVTVSLASGGAPAISQSIALMDLLLEYGIKVDEVHGTSGGSIVGAAYTYLDVEYSDKIYWDGRKLSTASLHKIANSLVSYKNLFELSPSLIGKWFRNIQERNVTGVLRGKRIKQEYEEFVPGTFQDIHTDLFIYAEPEGYLEYQTFSKDNFPHLKLSSAVRASIAMHHLFEPEVINGQRYFDGGVLVNTPLSVISRRHKDLGRKGPLVIFCSTCLYPLNQGLSVDKTFLSMIREQYVHKAMSRIFSLELYQLLLDDNVYVFLFYPHSFKKHKGLSYHTLQKQISQNNIDYKQIFDEYLLNLQTTSSKHPKFNYKYSIE